MRLIYIVMLGLLWPDCTDAAGRRRWPRRQRRKQTIGWYGPDANAEECLAADRKAQIIFKSDMKPSALCQDVKTEVCLCHSPRTRAWKKNKRYRQRMLTNDAGFADVDFTFKC